MRRFSSFLGILAVGLMLTAFSNAQDGKKVKKDAKSKTPNYYPVDVGNTWHFRVNANGKNVNITTRISKLEKIDGETLARLDSANVALTEHLKQTDKGVFRSRFNGAEVVPPFQLLPYPAKIGLKWKGEFTVGKERAKHTYAGEIQREETIEVPAGKFKTLRVLIQLEENGQRVETTYWFAKNVGFVKQTFETAGTMIMLELEKFERKK
ncbi:MAG: hypothetical protein HYX68_04180 [Planctomycetes bacterium]|nr:hypothetical protein [Planctomycetota bacterium]